ncbi:MAG TPA: DUF1631 domain-containing protein [Thiobacillaceae bacterium]|nr:DUF1631 domain-containing protein [Thiobacillaceae bacterium]
MQDSKLNVVELSQYSRPHAASGAHGSQLLDECGETMALRLGQALTKTLKRSGDDLLELIDHVTGYEMRRLYGEAREFTRDKAAAVEGATKRHFFLQFKRECRRDKSRGDRGDELDMSQLSLVEPEDLEESLAASNIAHAIGNICGEELFGLSKRMGVLLDDPELRFGDNPIGPEVIGAAVMDALREHTEQVKLRLALVPLIGKHLPKQVRDIYQDINRDLIERGVLPTIRVGLKRPQHASAAAPDSLREGGAGDAAPGGQPGAGQDLLAVLQHMLDLNAGGASPAFAMPGLPGRQPMPQSLREMFAQSGEGAAAAPGATAQSPAAAAFLQNLTNLQRGQTGVFPNPRLAAEQITNGQVNVLRELRSHAAGEGMGQMDVMVLDIVAMVFDYILDDSRIPDAMKALIGRLQIPVLKVAMLDRAFFSQKQHIVRRLLDTLADAAMGWDPQEGHQSNLYRKVDELVQRIVTQFEDQVDIFETCQTELEQYLREENQRMAEAASRSAQVIQSLERNEHAQALARDTVHGHLLEQAVPELIRDFLSRQWVQVLARIQGRDGENGEAWKEAVATMEDLIWSVEPKHVQNERKKLVELLPKLLKRLDQGLRGIGAEGEARDRFFTGLVKCHAEAVRAGMQSGPTGVQEQTAGQTLAEVPPPQPEIPAGPMDFESVPIASEDLMPSPNLLREIAAVREERQDVVEEITISDVHWLSGGEYRESDEHSDRVHTLKRGAWIQYRQEDGEMVRAKLAWVSPLKGVYLFTNRLGQRAMSINAEGLAAKFRDGSVQVIDNVPLMDRAVNNLLERLQQTVAVGSE